MGFFIELSSPNLIASLDSLAFCKKQEEKVQQKKLTQQNI